MYSLIILYLFILIAPPLLSLLIFRRLKIKINFYNSIFKKIKLNFYFLVHKNRFWIYSLFSFILQLSPNFGPLLAYIIVRDVLSQTFNTFYLAMSAITIFLELIFILIIWFKTWYKDYLNNLKNGTKEISFQNHSKFQIVNDFKFKVTYSSNQLNKTQKWYIEETLRKLKKSKTNQQVTKILYEFSIRYCSLFSQASIFSPSYKDGNKEISHDEFIDYFENYVFSLYQKFSKKV